MLNYIFHISDIHIRHGDRSFCRFDEYKSIFDRLFSSIRCQIDELRLTPKDFVIIVSGDIFHNKNIVGNYGLTLYKIFIEGLVAIGKTIVFHGNHDRNQNEIDQPSLVSSTLPIDNLTILNETTSFTIDDVGFSYMSIDDTLDFYKTCGRVDELPEFPLLDQNIKHKIALFHGTFAHVKLYNGQDVTTEFRPYPFEWLKRFDFAILGDIHLRQKGLYDKKTLWGYSGSLVQQNYGEDIINHGYMIWNLDDRKVKEVDVYNDIGYVNLKEEDNTIMIRKRGKYIPLEDMITSNFEIFPKRIEIKVYSQMNFSRLYQMMSKYGISANIVSNKIPTSLAKFQKQSITSDISILQDDNIVINKNILIEHFQHHLSKEQHALLSSIIQNNDKLLFDVEQYPVELHEDCHKKNKELSIFISNCLKSDDVNNARSPFRIKYLEWDNLYCYESNNHINFDETECNTFMIGGNNGTGKSAIYDIIVLAIWGDVTTCKQSSISNGIIHYRHQKANTIIDIETNGIDYRIQRTFGKQNGKNTLVKSCTQLYKKNDDKYEIFKKENSCTEVIKTMFGTLEEFLSSSMITQNVDFDLLKMNYKDCIAIIDKATNIDYVYNLYTLFKSSLNKYKDFRKIIESKEQVYVRLCNDVNVSKQDDDIEIRLFTLQKQKNSLEHENNSLAVDINEVNIIETNDIPDIDDCGENITNEEYAILQKRFHELEFILRDETDPRRICSKTILDVPIKPCEMSVIQNEEDNLKTYACENFNEFRKHTNKELECMLGQYKEKVEIYSTALEFLDKNKPYAVEKPDNYDVKVIKNIDKYYHNIDELLGICSKYQIYVENSDCHDAESEYHSSTEYIESKKQISIINKEIENTKMLIEKMENDMGELYESRSKLVNIEEEEFILVDTNINVNCENVSSEIDENNMILDVFYNKMNKVFDDCKRSQQYERELNELQNTCDYDPKCQYCCKQPWVVRMTELKQQIETIEQETDRFFHENDINYLELYTRNACLKYTRYQQFLEQRDHIEKSLKECAKIRTVYVQNINIYNEELQKLVQFIEQFHRQSNYLLKCYRYKEYLEKFDSWSIEFHKVKENKQYFDNKATSISMYMQYKPREEKLIELKKAYHIWEDNYMEYISSLFREKEIVEKQKNIYEIRKLKETYTNILRKRHILKELKNIEGEIKRLSEEITRYNTICSVHEKNHRDHCLLKQSLIDINSIIDVMEILIDKFKIYRKDIYQNVILKKLTEKTNTYLDKICHKDTKKFELGYVLTEVKDIIHINWLIKTKGEEKTQVISISQASGFQHFVISLALRMSLFGNKQCSQLFFDEGFTACDKLNLSVVPSFIQSLLQLFNSIIIVSHIDIIKDSIDIVTTIEYNEEKKSSKIEFGAKREFVH